MNSPVTDLSSQSLVELRALAARHRDTMGLTRDGAIRRVERLHDALLDACDRIEALEAASTPQAGCCERVQEAAAKACRDQAAIIGALPGSSIHSALEYAATAIEQMPLPAPAQDEGHQS